VGGGLHVALAPELQGVTDIADDPAVDRRNVLPLATRRLDLQACDVLAPKERQGAEVRVCAGPRVLHKSILWRRARMVEHVSQVVFGLLFIGMAGGEVVRGQLEDEGEECEDFGGEGEGSLDGVLV
jgi:hypothetical protein